MPRCSLPAMLLRVSSCSNGAVCCWQVVDVGSHMGHGLFASYSSNGATLVNEAPPSTTFAPHACLYSQCACGASGAAAATPAVPTGGARVRRLADGRPAPVGGCSLLWLPRW